KNYIKKLQQEGKKTEAIGYFEKPDKDVSIPLHYFTAKAVDWKFIPHKNILDEYAGKEFDLLLNFYMKECLTLEYLSALSKAKYRVGRYDEMKTHCSDFMISLKEQVTLQQFIEQSEHYLKQLHTHATT